MQLLLCLAFTALCILLIYRLPFFETEINRRGLSILFCFKLCFGVLLWYIYTYYYTDRSTADIYKYFDDSKVMYDALRTHPGDYFRMLFAIGNDNAYFDQQYYSHMNYWYREFDNAIYNDSHTIIRFNAFVRLFSFGYYNVHMIVMSFISFIGLVAIYKTFISELMVKPLGAIAVVFLVPSVLLWSSGVLKEGFLFFGLGMLVYNFQEACFMSTRNWTNYAWVAVSVLVLAVAKFYVLVCLLPGFIAWIWIRRTGRAYSFLKYLASALAVLLLALNIHYLFPSYNVLQVLSRRQQDFVALAKGGTYLISQQHDTVYLTPAESEKMMVHSEEMLLLGEGTKVYHWSANRLVDSFVVTDSDTTRYSLFKKYPPARSRIPISRLEPAVLSLAANAPHAFFNTLTRPFVWESRSPMILMPAIENLVILLVCLFCVLFGSFGPYSREVFFFSLLFVIMLYTLTGLITPVEGALVRYRVPAVPFLLIGCLAVFDSRRLRRKRPFWKRMGEKDPDENK